MTDPVPVAIAAAATAIVLLVGAAQKLRDLMLFEAAIEGYELAPSFLVKPLTVMLPVAEAAAGLLLLFPSVRAAGGALALAVIALVTAAVAVNLLRGRTDVSCGCGGVEDEQTLSWALVARNVALGASCMPRREAELRHEIGLRSIMWGSDYPHPEGSWPVTREQMQETFRGLPEDEIAAMLGGNAARFYGIDTEKLAPLVARIGPEKSLFRA